MQGVLNVHVLRARNLIKADQVVHHDDDDDDDHYHHHQTIFGGKSDPYVVLTIGETQISFVDDYIENSVNPEYGDTCDGDVDGDDDKQTDTEHFDSVNKVGLPC